MAHLGERERQILGRLARVFDVQLLSGRPQDFLDREFADMPISVAAEHGAYCRPPNGGWVSRIASDVQSWYGEAEKIMNDYSARVPLSFVENKSASLVWHYRQSPAEFADFQAKKLDDELQIGLANQPVTVGVGSKIVEARAVECNKGYFVQRLVEQAPPDSLFVCIGDDMTDEDMFKAVGSAGIAVKVGLEHTFANHRLRSQADVYGFLQALAASAERNLSRPGQTPWDEADPLPLASSK
jgi:trehalose 6-phosphate synthase/phosphatase